MTDKKYKLINKIRSCDCPNCGNPITYFGLKWSVCKYCEECSLYDVDRKRPVIKNEFYNRGE